jgi:beta-aspartyl-peptidase (threonine type)
MRVLPSAAAAAALLMTASGLLADDWSYDSQTDEATVQAVSPPAQSEVGRALEVAALEEAQLVAWNNHDLDAYLRWYWNNPGLISLDNGRATVGYSPFADQMRAVYGGNPALMGHTDMGRLRIKMIGTDVAVMVATYVTTTSNHADSIDDTAMVRHFPEGWRIVFESGTVHAQ